MVSLLTHIGTEEADRYLAETHRVLRPGGKILLSCFLLNAEVLLLRDLGAWKRKEEFRMPKIGLGGAMVSDYEVQYAVYWDEGCLRELLRKHDLIPETPSLYGGWCGRDRRVSGNQDMVIAVKR